MIAGVAFDLYAPQFALSVAAKIAGVNRAAFDMWLSRGYIQRSNKKGRPLFSARAIFKARLLQELSNSIALSDYRDVAAEAASIVADTGEWMWSTARCVEEGKPRMIYAYATRIDGKWKFDMHIGKRANRPCFGWEHPHVFVPMSEIFGSVYVECRKLIREQDDKGE
jgi:hypothetical protein